MNYHKIDPSLAMLLSGQEAAMIGSIDAFAQVHAGYATSKGQFSDAWGVDLGSPSRTVVTVRVPPAVIAELSEVPWVKYITLAQGLRPNTYRGASVAGSKQVVGGVM